MLILPDQGLLDCNQIKIRRIRSVLSDSLTGATTSTLGRKQAGSFALAPPGRERPG